MRKLPMREGFTLVELLITIVIVGILAMIAMSQFWSAKDRGLETTMQSDLKTFAVQQENYYTVHNRYASSPQAIDLYSTSPGVLLTITYSAADGWAARTTHPSVPNAACGFYFGQAPAETGAPASVPGIVQCTPQ
ncbi:N/A [soil metagenome]